MAFLSIHDLNANIPPTPTQEEASIHHVIDLSSGGANVAKLRQALIRTHP